MKEQIENIKRYQEKDCLNQDDHIILASLYKELSEICRVRAAYYIYKSEGVKTGWLLKG